MAKYKIFFSARAKKDMVNLTEETFNRIVNGCKLLEDNPSPDGKHVKKLKGYENLYRLRVGGYRVVFQWEFSEIIIVTIITRQKFGKKY